MWTFVLTISVLCWVSEAVVTCKNNNDEEVDWFIIYKTPQVQQRSGLNYLYIDSTGAEFANSPSNSPPNNPTSSQPSSQPNNQPMKRPNNQPVRQPNNQPMKQPKNQPGSSSNNPSNSRPSSPSSNPNNNQPGSPSNNPNNNQHNSRAINDPDGILANTLRPLFVRRRQMPASFGYILYSDQPPGRNSHSMFGHSKGLLLVDRTGPGVWLLHSTPQFPYRKDRNNFWPPSGMDNAQTFICVTLRYDDFVQVGQHLQYISAFPFDHDIPLDFHEDLRRVGDWAERNPPNNVPLTTRGGANLRLFAKQTGSGATDGDLYVAIAQHFRSAVYAQTWPQTMSDKSFGEGNLHRVYNVKEIFYAAVGAWKRSCDHSKWCVVDDPNLNWVCIADVNRAQNQYHRRGGALCLESQDAKNVFRALVRDHEALKDPVSTAPCS